MGLLRLFYERLRTSILYRRANLILVNSIGSRDQLSKATMIKKNNIVVLPNSVDINLIRSLAKQRIEPFINQFVKGKKVIVSVGRLVRNKDFSTLIKAFNRLEEKNIVLLILGEGNLEYQLQSLINRLNLEKKILLTGFIDNPYSIVAKSDVFVLSSIFEGMPNSLIEAMVLNIPIVATDCPSGPKEILMDGEHGILVPVNDSKLMADAIINQLCESSRIYPVKADLNKYSNVKVGEYLLIEINRLLS